MSGDIPRASFANLFFGEIVGPLVIVALTLIPYLFINSQTGVIQEHNPGAVLTPTNAILRVAIVAFAPIGINAGVCAVFFGMACCMGPVLSMCCKKFGSVLAAIAHAIAVIMLLVMAEVMFFLEGFVFTKAVLGMIAASAIQRFIYKLIISLALTREFKSDTSNIAFWTGKWYSMGWHSVSQPAREFLCKITELGMFAGDFVLGHIILFLMLPVIAIPHIDKAHSVMLFWLRPSRQIRPPIYSMKQSKLRKRRVWRFAILYFTLLILFIALLVGPIVAGSKIISPSLVDKIPLNLYQPVGLHNNDTRNRTETGTGAVSNGASNTAGASATAKMIKLF